MRQSTLFNSQSYSLRVATSVSKILLVHTYIFSFIFLCSALSIVNIPFVPQELLFPLILPCTVTCLIYFPKSTWGHLLLVGLWMDHVFMFFPGTHGGFMLLAYVAIRILETFAKQYTFLSHWGLFTLLSLLYFMGISLLSGYFMSKDIPLSFLLTVFSFPLLLSVFRTLLYPAARLKQERV